MLDMHSFDNMNQWIDLNWTLRAQSLPRQQVMTLSLRHGMMKPFTLGQFHLNQQKLSITQLTFRTLQLPT